MASKKLPATTLAILIPFVGALEGLRQYAYKDPVGVPTICFGYTAGVEMGQYKSKEECEGLLREELEVAYASVYKCLGTGLTDGERAAYTSLVYNVGPRAVCGSTIQRRYLAGNRTGACDFIPRWKYAHGIVLPGIVRRREEERKLCLE